MQIKNSLMTLCLTADEFAYLTVVINKSADMLLMDQEEDEEEDDDNLNCVHGMLQVSINIMKKINHAYANQLELMGIEFNKDDNDD